MAETSIHMPLGIVVERRAIEHRWAKERWLPVDVLPGAAPASWHELAQGDGWARFHAATLPLELHRKETEHYRYNLSGERPAIFVVMRAGERAGFPFEPVHATASPFESLAYTEFGEDRVEPVPMPPGIIAWVQDFIDRHHVEEPFFKRRRKGRNKALGEGSDFLQVGGGRDE